MSEYTLDALSWQPWAAHLKALGSPAARWFWCDLDGAHLSPRPPSRLRGVTHVWGWTAATWWRFRCDGTDAVGAQLAIASRSGAGAGEPCRVVETPSTTWATGDGRTALTQALRGRAVVLRQTVDPVLLDFLEVA